LSEANAVRGVLYGEEADTKENFFQNMYLAGPSKPFMVSVMTDYVSKSGACVSPQCLMSLFAH
jgi:hypothetical protein